MNKLSSFKYRGMIFHNVKDNFFQTDRFGDKLIYEYKDGQYHLLKDERLSSTISLSEFCENPYSYCNNDNNWK